MLRSLDLFSGCGGMAFGLRDVCTPVAYCDKEIACRLALADNFKRKLLEKAPVYEDVRSLPDVPDFDILCAGFPCKNISGMGDRRGMRGEHSGLLRHAIDVVASKRPRHVLLENVPNICTLTGVWGYLLRRLTELGYDACWTCLLYTSPSPRDQRGARMPSSA